MIPNIKLLQVVGTKKPAGRRSTYSDALANEICDRIANGESLRAICGGKGMPSKATVMRWLDDGAHPYLRNAYAFACWWRGQELLDEVLEIADDTSQDIIYDRKGRPRGNWSAIARARLRIQARIWLYEVTVPKKYQYGALAMGAFA